MKRFAVEITDAAMAEIRDHARYIAFERFDPGNAQSWLSKVWEAVDTLDAMPRAHPIAEESEDVDYEVRFVLAGRDVLLFTVDDERDTVWIIGLRGRGRLPRPDELPHDTDALEIERATAILRAALIKGELSGDAGPLDFDEIIRQARLKAGLPPKSSEPEN